ncbi:IS701 family transposase [Vacuolonema iberomarrocanum]|uniref:IS701 family transposase n=1 Tax=Vacuolonema iberomarrocanum TaxID=3454632 RepID=UPI001A042131|nr:IS701 family transposase [filamentous cyanobacterium LEGE 07170]
MTVTRKAKPTVQFVDEYCDSYRDLFVEVRSFEAFKRLHVGMVSKIKRKSLPAIAKVTGLRNPQSLQQFLVKSPWQAKALRHRRLELIRALLNGHKLVLVIDETGDRKKGHTTDYVKRQYIDNLGKVENGIVSVDACGVIDNITFPLTFEVYKPQECLNPGETYRSKPQIAVEMVQQLQDVGFAFDLVLVDSKYGERANCFVSLLRRLQLPYVLATRSNHVVGMPKKEQVRANNWWQYQDRFSHGKSENHFIREIVYGRRGSQQYWQLTTDKERLPKTSTWMITTWGANISYQHVGVLYGLKHWVQYGFKQGKDDLGWADFRFTNYGVIEKWWEVVMSAYLMVTLQTPSMQSEGTLPPELD